MTERFARPLLISDYEDSQRRFVPGLMGFETKAD